MDFQPLQLDATEVRVPNTYLRFFLRALGNDPRLLSGTGETARSLAELGGQHSLAAYAQFLHNAENITANPTVGLQLGTIDPLISMHGPLSVALLNSQDLQDCLNLLVQYGSLRNPGIQARAVQNTDFRGIEFRLLAPLDRGRRLTVEIFMLAINRLLSSISGNSIRQGIVELDYPAPAYADVYHQTFSASAVRFNTHHIRLWLPISELHKATDLDADPALRESAIQRMQQEIKHLDMRLSVNERVMLILGNNPGHLWSVTEVAKHLNLAPRTLQRHLRQVGCTFLEIRDTWVMRQACELLNQRQMSIEAIANLLGYSDVSNFRQAFRRVLGVAPGRYRMQDNQPCPVSPPRPAQAMRRKGT